ncbi:MAG: carboxynorspermidine decarboxylase [Desulfurivibrionaceae bacterium]|nr:carboxynorspermidine decarboxylase [Desulfurivibrionaceae bacterium]
MRNEGGRPYQELVPSPCFVLEEERLLENLAILGQVQAESGARILLALKAFAMFSVFDLVGGYLCGAAASGLNEARLAREEMGKEVHTFCPAIKEGDFPRLAALSDHLIFNSFSQWQRYRDQAGAYPQTRFGMRVNPRHSEGAVAIYDPCAPGSRLGVTASQFKAAELSGLSGLHFHTLCEQEFAPLARTVAAFEQQFGPYLAGMEWLNFGGGHHITRPGYDVAGLVQLLIQVRERYNVQLYLEPGEAISYQTGTLVGEVVDLVWNDRDIAILDVSAATHMPDVLEMPYRPEIIGAGRPGEKAHTYRLAGPSCLAGDIIGDYSFNQPLAPGQRLVFTDMIHYTMVKTNTFNGVGLPAIAIWRQSGELQLVKEFGYEDFKGRLS